MFQNWSAVYIVQFLCFVYCCFYISAFRKGDLADHLFKFLLLRCQIVVCYMTRSLEAIREWNRLLSLLQSLKPVEYFLIRQIIKVELNIAFNDGYILYLVFV